jgi:stage II sporulation protein M
MKAKNFSLAESYKECFSFLKQNQNFIWFALAIFLILFIIGLLFPIFYEGEIINFVRSLSDKISHLNAGELIEFIFLNNIKSSFFALLFGIGICIFPISVLIINGYLIGFVLNHSIQAGGILVIWKILPHGIFEIPAVLISAGLGIYLGFSLIHNFIKKYEKKDSTLIITIIAAILSPVILFLFLFIKTLFVSDLRIKLKLNFYNSIRTFIFIVIPLLIIAAIIEGLLIFFLR